MAKKAGKAGTLGASVATIQPEYVPTIEMRPLHTITPYINNAKTHPDSQVDKIAGSIHEFKFDQPIVVDGDGIIIKGHGRYRAALKLGMVNVPVTVRTDLTPGQVKQARLADNKVAESPWDEVMLSLELQSLSEDGFDLSLTGFDDTELESLLKGSSATEPEGGGAGSLAARFGIPPFSVLNAREGWWQARKKAWIEIGIKSELGRGSHGNVAPGGSPLPSPDYMQSGKCGLKGKAATSYKSQASLNAIQKQSASYKGMTFGTTVHPYDGTADADGFESGTSIFDPVLTELVYRWFSAKEAMILDPFAGGSVRGIVAGMLDRQYIGIDLRSEQVEANRGQADKIIGGTARPVPSWTVGDSRNIDRLASDVRADLLFSCPPYGNLEQYSDDPADLSSLDDYQEFLASYRLIINESCKRLKDDRFACFVVGDYRDKAGLYRNFVSETISAFLAAGLSLYNEAILVTAVGSLPIRAAKQFIASRKLGKTHQNVLIFVKGSPEAATSACGIAEFGDVEGLEETAASTL